MIWPLFCSGTSSTSRRKTRTVNRETQLGHTDVGNLRATQSRMKVACALAEMQARASTRKKYADMQKGAPGLLHHTARHMYVSRASCIITS